MLLQVALDFLTIDEALRLIEKTAPHADIFEIGTPLLLREGRKAVSSIHAAFPEIHCLADAKIVDGGYEEAKMLFEAGAEIVTTLAVAAPQTLRLVKQAAREHGGRVAADLIASSDPLAAVEALEAAEIDIACIHRAADSGRWQLENSRLLEKLASKNRSLEIMVAGGIGLDTISSILPLAPDIVVVGGSIVNDADPAEAARRIREAISEKTGPTENQEWLR